MIVKISQSGISLVRPEMFKRPAGWYVAFRKLALYCDRPMDEANVKQSGAYELAKLMWADTEGRRIKHCHGCFILQ